MTPDDLLGVTLLAPTLKFDLRPQIITSFSKLRDENAQVPFNCAYGLVRTLRA
jgi:hypothetical protein